MKRDNAAGVRAVYEALKKRILQQLQSERKETYISKNKQHFVCDVRITTTTAVKTEGLVYSSGSLFYLIRYTIIYFIIIQKQLRKHELRPREM